MQIGAIGLCVPQECDEAQDWEPILATLSEYLKVLLPAGLEAELKVSFPYQIAGEPFPSSFWIVGTLMVLMILLSIFGSAMSVAGE